MIKDLSYKAIPSLKSKSYESKEDYVWNQDICIQHEQAFHYRFMN